MNYTITGLSAKPYTHLYGLSDNELEAHGVKRCVADESPGYPDRIEMRDAKVGETLLLLNHVSVDKDTPFKASHAIFILEGAENTYREKNRVPPVMYNRMISLRAFDKNGMMVEAELAQGDGIEPAVKRLLEREEVSHIDAHNALRGCYSGRITRG